MLLIQYSEKFQALQIKKSDLKHSLILQRTQLAQQQSMLTMAQTGQRTKLVCYGGILLMLNSLTQEAETLPIDRRYGISYMIPLV
jgi:hypothetical protein